MRDGGGRPPGRRDISLRVLEGIAQSFPTERAFWAHVATLAKAGDSGAMIAIADRIAPKLRPQSAPVNVEVPQNSDIVARADAIIAAATRGDVGVEEACGLITALGSFAKLREFAELESRLAALEARGLV